MAISTYSYLKPNKDQSIRVEVSQAYQMRDGAGELVSFCSSSAEWGSMSRIQQLGVGE